MDNREIRNRFGLNVIGLCTSIFIMTFSYLSSYHITFYVSIGMIPGFIYYLIKYGRMVKV